MSNANTVSGGKTWSIPSADQKVTTKTPDPYMMDPFGNIVLAGFATVGLMGIGTLLIALTGWNFLDPFIPQDSTSSIASPDTGYSAVIPNKEFSIFILTALTTSSMFILTFALKYWSKFIMRITILCIAFLPIITSSAIMENSLSSSITSESAIEWMQTRYGFTPENKDKAANLKEDDYLLDPTTKTVAKVKKQDNKLYLYDINGTELPRK